MKYINPEYTLEEFFEALNNQSVKYVVLRWFEDFATLTAQPDIDMLVADEDVALIFPMIVKDPPTGPIRIDIYSGSGRFGSSFRKVPYYPRHFADRLLQDRVLRAGLYFVPSDIAYFFSFIFHVVYHKAERSGIPVDEYDGISLSLSNKYVTEINRIAKSAGVLLPEQITLNALRDFLNTHEWQPSIEWTRKIGINQSPFLMSLFPRQAGLAETAVFVVREKAAGMQMHEHLTALFTRESNQLVYYSELDEVQRDKAMKFLRGGKWDHLPNVDWGGPPHSVYVLHDPSPEEVNSADRNDYPYLANQRFLNLKLQARTMVQELLGSATINCLHCSDDNLEAMEYLDCLFASRPILTELKELLKTKSSLSGLKSIRKIPVKSNRTLVEIIDFQGSYAVSKTFKPGNGMYFRRELFAYHFLAPRFKYIPQLHAYSKSRLIIAYIDFDDEQQGELLKAKLSDVALLVKDLWLNEVAHLDIHPGNLIVDKKGELYLIDYEFLYRYEQKPASIFESYDLKGLSDAAYWGIKGKNPAKYIHDRWKDLTGYTLRDILQLYLPDNTEL